jgi:preprotein translocase subunit SecE
VIESGFPGSIVYSRGGVPPAMVMAKTNPLQFLQQVRQETNKVTWPTRRDTLITTAMVFVFVLVSSLFFLAADQIIAWGIGLVLGLGR